MPDVSSWPLFYEIAALLVLAASVGLLGLALRQPLIVSYIAVGLLAGPSALGIARAGEHIELLAELGIAVLLFLVGLKLDLGLIRSIGPVAVATGLGQVFFTAAIGFVICLGFGLDWVASLYVAIALTFSSTIIIVKLLSDKGELGSLHGRIALGFLIVQDIFVVLSMVVLSTVGVGGGAITSPLPAPLVILAMFGSLGGVVLFMRYLAEPLVDRLARSGELLVAFAIGWAALLAALGDWLGFGKELGGLLAGVSLASTRYREAISTRLASLRDFLLLFFFIALGARIELPQLGADLPTAAALSLFVLIGNPLIVVWIMGAMGYRRRTGFLAGLTVAQISEFSLVFMAMGLELGHVQERAVGLVTVVGLVTIALSVYMITYSQRLFDLVEPLLRPFERRVPTREAAVEAAAAEDEPFDVIVVGLGRYGGAILRRLEQQGLRVLGIDASPATVRRMREQGATVIYGDATDPGLIATLPLDGVGWVVSAVAEHDLGVTHIDPRIALMDGLRANGFTGRIAVAAHQETYAASLERSGADIVLRPFRDAAEQACDVIAGALPRPAASAAAERTEEAAS